MPLTEKSKVLAAILGCIAIYGITLGLSRPLLSLLLESRDVSRTLIGLNATMPALGILLSAPVIPALIRRFGIKTFLISCLFIDLCMFLSYPLFDLIYVWFVVGIVTGAAGNCLLVVSETWINEIVTDQNRGKVLGFYNAIFAATTATGPIIIPIIGIHGWSPFLLGGLFISLASIPLFWLGASLPTMGGKPTFSILSFVFVAPTLIFATLLFSWSQTAGGSLLPVYGVRNGMDNGSAALMLTISGCGAVLMAYPIGWLADKMDRFGLLILCSLGIALGAYLLPVAMESNYILWPLLFFWGGSFAGSYVVILTIIGQHFRGMDLAMANVSIGVVWGIGALTGPSVTGAAMDIWDPEGFTIVFSVASTTFLLFAIGRWLLAKDKSTAI